VFISGLTCTEQNFITKSGFQQFAAKHGVIVVAPDTSPRKLCVYSIIDLVITASSRCHL